MNPGLRGFPQPPPARQLSTGAIVASARGLVIQYVSAATLTIAADEVTLKDLDGNSYLVQNLAATTVTMDANNGPNRLDRGSEASSSWYYVWLCSDGASVYGLLSLADGKTLNNAGAAAAPYEPALPAGCTYRALVGVVRNDGSSNFVNFYQTGREVMVVPPLVLNFAVTTVYAVLAGGNLTTFQANVPPLAKSFFGNVATSASIPYLAADTTGLGETSVAGYFRAQLNTNNIAVKAGAGTPTYTMTVSGYTL